MSDNAKLTVGLIVFLLILGLVVGPMELATARQEERARTATTEGAQP